MKFCTITLNTFLKFNNSYKKREEFKFIMSSVFKLCSDTYTPNLWIAGGFLRRYIENSELFDGDIDLWTTGTADIFKSIHKSLKCFPATKSNMGKKYTATIYTEGLPLFSIQKKSFIIIINLINRYYYNHIECMESFDFTNSQLATDGEIVCMNERTIQDIKDRKLVSTDTRSNTVQYYRVKKFLEQGYIPDLEDQNKRSAMNVLSAKLLSLNVEGVNFNAQGGWS